MCIFSNLLIYSLYIIFRFKIFSLFPTRLVTLLNKTSYMLFPLNMVKYISCCSLSPIYKTFEELTNEFQYISCCSLSGTPEYPRCYSFEFQYISCCSLSIAFSLLLFSHFIFRPVFSLFFRFLPGTTPILFSMSSIA